MTSNYHIVYDFKSHGNTTKSSLGAYLPSIAKTPLTVFGLLLSSIIAWVLLCGLILVSSRTPLAQTCSDSYPEWSVGNGDMLVNGKPFHLKGASWFGFESEENSAHGLSQVSIDHLINRIKTLGINAIRLPFSASLVLKNPCTRNIDCNLNGQYVSKFNTTRVCDLKSLDLMEYIVDKLGEHGILVMLDQHRLYGGPYVDIETWITPLWKDDTFSEQTVLHIWDLLLKRFGRKWNVFALDLKNEPRNPATWGKNNLTTDWNQAAQRIINYIADRHPEYKGLFFVGGVEEKADTLTPNTFGHWWGGNMEGIHRHPIKTGHSNRDRRVVYSPHTYGPDVHYQRYFKVPEFPKNMPLIWDLHFGFVEQLTDHPIVTGEWGGKYGEGPTGQKDIVWHNAFVDYLMGKCMSDNFYWSLNPESIDTGGLLLNDWTTINEDKKQVITRLQPKPSKLTFDGTSYCLTPGARANTNCGPARSISSFGYDTIKKLHGEEFRVLHSVSLLVVN